MQAPDAAVVPMGSALALAMTREESSPFWLVTAGYRRDVVAVERGTVSNSGSMVMAAGTVPAVLRMPTPTASGKVQEAIAYPWKPAAIAEVCALTSDPAVTAPREIGAGALAP